MTRYLVQSTFEDSTRICIGELISEIVAHIITMATPTGINIVSKTSIYEPNIQLHLEYIPEEVFEMVNLEEVSIIRHPLKELSPRIGNLRNLKKLTVFLGKITSLPEELFSLRNLEYLSIGENLLTYIPTSIQKLTLLQVALIKWVINSFRSSICMATISWRYQLLCSLLLTFVFYI